MLVAVRTLFQRLEEQAGGLKDRWSPGVGLRAAALAGGGFLSAAASLAGAPQPLAMGLILRFGGWKSLAACLGAMGGYRFFWGEAGEVGLWWALAAGLLALPELPEKLRPLLGTATAALTGVFLSGSREMGLFLLRLAAAGGSIHIWSRRDRTGRWLRCALGGLTLAQLAPGGWLGLGYAACAALAVGGSFPGAALAGLGVDLAGVTALPMTAVTALAWLGKLEPRLKKLRWCFPAAAAAAAMVCLELRDWRVLPGLLLGGGLGLLLPPVPGARPAAGSTGAAQVGLEQGALAMERLGRGLLEQRIPPPDGMALLQRVRTRACGGCPLRGGCLEQNRLTVTALAEGHPFPCRRPGRLRPELTWARDRLRLLGADRRRREEYRQVLAGQYRASAALLRRLADQLPRTGRVRLRFGVAAALRTRGRSGSNGDRWAAFPGTEGCYYVLLCDGMGTGPGAGEEGIRAARLLRQLLKARFSPAEALESLNAQLTLGGRGAAVTVDLAQLRLDTGEVRLYKWGAAPSWRVKDGKAERLGAVTPPPGFSVTGEKPWRGRLSLGGEGLLIMLSDGVDPRRVPETVARARGAAPGELAERLLEGEREDDATAAVIRLYAAGGRQGSGAGEGASFS